MKIYDNTLREGSQSSLINLSDSQKLSILDAQIEAGIEQIEIGFIAAGVLEEKSIKKLLARKTNSKLYVLARLLKEDIDKCIGIGCQNVTIFVPSSDYLIKTKFEKAKQDINQIEENIASVISYAANKGLSVRFSCEDATRTEKERLLRFYSIAVKNGAHTISVPDTFGISNPYSYGKLIKYLTSNLSCTVSSHCHNDLGLALANSLSCFENGGTEIQTTIYGIGDRVGNADLIQTLVSLKKFYDSEPLKSILAIKKLYEKFNLITGFKTPVNFPILSENQFQHESGLHVRALLNNEPYEAFPSDWIGVKHSVLYGQLSGKANIEYICQNNNICLDQNEIDAVLTNVKSLSSNKRRNLTEEEVIKIIKKEIYYGNKKDI